MDRVELSVSSKSLTTLFWNLGNWKRGETCTLPAFIDHNVAKKIYYKDDKPDTYPDHVPENNDLFLQMIRNRKAHLALNCEAGALLPYQKHGRSRMVTLLQ